MTNLINFNYNGTVIQRRADGFVNLTQMCQANGKRLDNWLRLKGTQSYLDTLSNSLTSEVVYSEEGVTGGTWGHPSVAINLARWLSDHFAVWCDAHIFNLMETGETSLAIDPIQEMQAKIELQKLINEGKLLETQANQSQLALYQFRHNVVSLCPEVVQQKVLGYQTVKEIEYRDRVIKDDDVINDGSTITKNELCRRYKLFTANGKPDYRMLNRYIEESRLADNKEAWQLSATIQEYSQLKREFVPILDRYFNTTAQRDLFLGE